MHLPSELRKRYKIRVGDKVELRATKEGIVLNRIPTLMEGFGQYRGLAKQWAIESLEEKRAELASEERDVLEEQTRVRRRARGPKIRA